MPAGPPPTETAPGTDPYLVVARLVRPRGNRGELVAEIETDFPERRLQPGPALVRDPRGRIREMNVEDTWVHKTRIVVKFEGVDSISDAEAFRGHEWVIPEGEALELPEGAHFRHRLVGLEARTPAGGTLGSIAAVQPGKGGDLLVLDVGGREVLVPAVRQYVLQIHEDEGYAVFDLPEDLLRLNP